MPSLDSSPSASTRPLRLTIEDLSVSGLPQVGLFHRSPKPYAVITVGKFQKTGAASTRTRNPKWGDRFELFAESNTATIQIDIFHRALIGNDVLLVSFQHKIHELTGEPGSSQSGAQVKLQNFTFKLTCTIDAVQQLESDVAAAEPACAMPDYSIMATLHATNELIATGNFNGGTISELTEPLGSSSAFTQVLGYLERLLSTVDSLAEINPVCKVAWQALSSAYKLWQQHAQEAEAIRDLAVELRDMLAFANTACDLKRIEKGPHVIVEMCDAIQTCAKLIQEFHECPRWRGVARLALSTDMSKRIQECRDRFTSLNKLFDRAIGVETWEISKETADKVEELHTKLHLKDQRQLVDRLPSIHALGAGYDSVTPCQDGTRQEILQLVLQLLMDKTRSDGFIIWIHGLAGKGKSTVATTVSRSLRDSHTLGGAFFFSRSHADRNDPKLVFNTLARQLAYHSAPLLERISYELHQDSGVGDRNATVATQYEHLIYKPLQSAGDLCDPFVIVLDAFDECSAPETILGEILSQMPLPKALRILITSRKEIPIQDGLDRLGREGTSVRPINLNEDQNIDNDIALFISTQLSDVASLPRYHLQKDWPGDDHRRRLVKKAGGLFIWASTVVKFIQDEQVSDPPGQLEVVLGNHSSDNDSGSSPSAALDALYLQVFEQAFKVNSPQRRIDLFRSIVGAIIIARNPLSPTGLETLLFPADTTVSTPKSVMPTIWKLQAVLDVRDSSTPIHIIHPSLVDFLTHRTLDTRFSIDPALQHLALACQCLHLMRHRLKKNLCNLDKFVFNSEIPDLSTLTAKHIPEGLQYACRFWADHLCWNPTEYILGCTTEILSEIYELLKIFYSKCLLSWLEVMSLTGTLESATKSLTTVNLWLQKLVVDSDTRQLVNDGPEFLRHFEDAIAAKALFAHLAWDLTPKSSAIYRVYSVNSANEIATFPRISSDWTSISSGAEYHPRAITSVAFSPDGNRVVSGSQGGLLQLWDASTGDPVRDALVGHSAAVRTLAFSPDGNRIVSGSTDATLRLCDAMSWTLIGKPLRGHAAAVQSVTFSPDGTQVVSGSFDGMVRLWETETGRPIGNPFTGHAGPVLSVSYSPLGNMVGSGGWDTTVRVWDVETGTTIGPTLPCHASTVDSVVYSPEGAQLASGSSDGMVHFCNAETGTPLDKMCIHGARFGSPAAFSRDRVLPPFRLVLSETGWVILSTAARDLKMTWVPQLRRGGVQAFTNDGRLCIGLRDGQLMMVDARNVLTESLRNTVGTIDLWGDQLTDPFPRNVTPSRAEESSDPLTYDLYIKSLCVTDIRPESTLMPQPRCAVRINVGNVFYQSRRFLSALEATWVLRLRLGDLKLSDVVLIDIFRVIGKNSPRSARFRLPVDSLRSSLYPYLVHDADGGNAKLVADIVIVPHEGGGSQDHTTELAPA